MLKKILKWFLELLLGGALLAGAYYFYRTYNVTRTTAQKRSSEIFVTARKMTPGVIEDDLPALGTAVSNQAVDLTAVVTEKVTGIFFNDGQIVNQGDLLVQLRNDEVLAERKQLEATLAETRRELERIEKLLTNRAVAQKEFDMQQTKVQLAEAALEGIEARLRDRRIEAPFTGRIGIRQVDLGALVSAGTVIASLDDISQIKVDFTVPEKYALAIRPDMEFQITGEALPGEMFTGKIAAVSSRIDPVSRSLTVRGIVDNPEQRLQSGMLLRVLLKFGQREALLVPERAISSLGEKQYVFTLDEKSVVRRREVVLGVRQDGKVEIVSGLKPGSTIVLDGIGKVVDGITVTRLPEAK